MSYENTRAAMITEMLTNPRILVVVPTYFEVDNIDGVLRAIRAALPSAHVLVIDDGSTDGTREAVMAVADKDSQVELVCRDRKAGLGDAYREGFTRGIADGMDLLVEIDADHSHDPAMLPALVSAACHGADVVIGSRYVPGGRIIGWSRSRLRLSRWGNRYAAVALGLAVNDATSGFRVYRSSIVQTFGLEGVRASGYGFQVEMTYRAIRCGARVVEIPIEFRERASGESKMSRRIVVEAMALVTGWALRDLMTARRRRRMYIDAS